jgi:hypothetical protein
MRNLLLQGHSLTLNRLIRRIMFLDIIHRPFFYHDVSETELCLRLQVKPTQLGPIDRASPHLRTPVPCLRLQVKPTQFNSCEN